VLWLRYAEWYGLSPGLQRDDEPVSSQSTQALLCCSLIGGDLNQRDETIAKNSTGFRWIEIRRSARRARFRSVRPVSNLSDLRIRREAIGRSKPLFRSFITTSPQETELT